MEFPLLPRAARLYGDLARAKRHYEVGWGFVLKRFFGTLRRRGLHRRPSLDEGLLDPRIPEEVLDVTLNKSRLMQLQRSVNPGNFVLLTEDKSVFYAYCSARGLPVPRFLGLSAKTAGYSADGTPLATPGQWRAFAESLPDQFVVKPSRGAWGRGVRMFRREEAGYADDAGGWHRAEDLGRATLTHPAYDRFVIQERLRSHPDLVRLSGSSHLQTVRILSWIRDNGEVMLPLAVFKVIVGDSLLDNYDHGRTGNLLALVDVGTGELEGAVGPAGPGVPIGLHRVHPRTSLAFDGFSIPLWEEACSLVRRAARLFLPLRTIGWDVAVTPDGPVLVEGNNFWDPVNYAAHSRRESVVRDYRAFLRELEADARSSGR